MTWTFFFDEVSHSDLKAHVQGLLDRGVDPEDICIEEAPGDTEMEVKEYPNVQAISRAITRLGKKNFTVFSHGEFEDPVEGSKWRLEAWRVTPRWRVSAWLDPSAAPSSEPS